MARLHVLSPGFFTSVQDSGRFGFAHLGVSASGAADPVSLRLGNLLVGNDETAAGLEMTLVGASIRFEGETTIALTGSDIQPKLDGLPLAMWTSVFVKSGQILHCGATRNGARTYLNVAGGITVPSVLGSASTHVMTGLGGFEGRILKKGDVLALDHDAAPGSFRALRISKEILRVTSAPQTHWFSEEEFQRFLDSGYTVTEESNRMGLRLTGTPIFPRERKELVTEGASLGAIQIPPDGQPIILFVEHQTTGGYPKIANVTLTELFPTRIRGTAQGFCYNVGRAFSALAPMIIGALGDRFGIGSAFALTSVFYLAGAGLMLLLPETRGERLV